MAELPKVGTTWRSERMQREARLTRWGHFGKPVLIFPTAGGDSEEIERMHMVGVLRPLVDAGRLKVYSCDSVAGKAMLTQEGTPAHRMWLINMFHQYVRHEVVPAIRMDCRDENATVIAAGASIGAFHAAAVLCRFPNLFTHALCASGTYKIERFLGVTPREVTSDFAVSSPMHFVPTLGPGPHLDLLRQRFLLITSGEGRAEDIGESWALANTLGGQGIPNRVDSWGKDWPHDWQTWREMFPKYLAEWC
jgi:esterase/lipase superfamily enzyme